MLHIRDHNVCIQNKRTSVMYTLRCQSHINKGKLVHGEWKVTE